MKFKVGEVYKDRAEKEYTLVAHAYHNNKHAQLIFISDGISHYRHVDGKQSTLEPSNLDILLPEKKTIKLYPALYKSDGGQKFYTEYLHEICPEDAIRLLTEYPPVVVEVDE